MDDMSLPADYADIVAEFWRSMPQFFPASSACDTLLRERLASSRHRARQLCVAMAQDGVFLRVGAPPSPFVDDHSKWRLTWTSAEETRNNVLLQRAVPVDAPPEALLANHPNDTSAFDDALSLDSDNNWGRFNHDDDDDTNSDSDSEQGLESHQITHPKHLQIHRADPLALRTQLQLLQGKARNITIPKPQSTNTSDSYVGSYSPSRSGSGIRYRNAKASNINHLEHDPIFDSSDPNLGSDSPLHVATSNSKPPNRRDRPKSISKPGSTITPILQDNSTLVIPSSSRVPRGIRLDDLPVLAPPRPNSNIHNSYNNNGNIANPAFPRPPSFGSMRSVPKGPHMSSNAAEAGPLRPNIPGNQLQSPVSTGRMHSVPRGVNMQIHTTSASNISNGVEHRRVHRGINLDTKHLSPSNSMKTSDPHNGFNHGSSSSNNPLATNASRSSFELHANVFEFPMSPPRSPSVDTVHCVPKIKIPVEHNSMLPPLARAPSPSASVDRGDGTISNGNLSRKSGVLSKGDVPVVARNNRFALAQSQHNSLSSWDRQKFVRNSSFDAMDNRKFTRNSSFDAMQAKRKESSESNHHNNHSNGSQYGSNSSFNRVKQSKERESSNPAEHEAAAPVAEAMPLAGAIAASAKISTPLHVLAKQARGLDAASDALETRNKKRDVTSVADASNILADEDVGHDDDNDGYEDVLHGELDKPVALPVEENTSHNNKLPAPPKVIVEDVVQGPLDDTIEFELSPFGKDAAFDGPPAGRGHLPAIGGNNNYNGTRRKENKNKNKSIPAVDQPSVEKRAKMLGRERHLLSEKRLPGLSNSNNDNLTKPPLASPRRANRGPPSVGTAVTTGDTLPAAHEGDIPLPNVGMIREKLKRAFQPVGVPPAASSPPSTPQYHQHRIAAQAYTNNSPSQNGEEGKHNLGKQPHYEEKGIGAAIGRNRSGNAKVSDLNQGETEFSSVPARDRTSLPAEVSPVTTPRKPWRILRAFSGRPPTHNNHGNNMNMGHDVGRNSEENSSTFTDSEGDGNETANTIGTANTMGTNTTTATVNGTNSVRTSKTQSLRERVLNSLRRSTRRTGRDAYADRLDYGDHGTGSTLNGAHINGILNGNGGAHGHQAGPYVWRSGSGR